jgi:hypothetical protein
VWDLVSLKGTLHQRIPLFRRHISPSSLHSPQSHIYAFRVLIGNVRPSCRVHEIADAPDPVGEWDPEHFRVGKVIRSEQVRGNLVPLSDLLISNAGSPIDISVYEV